MSARSEGHDGETSALLDPTASMSSVKHEDDEPLTDEVHYKVYPQRWYILILFTLFNATGNLLWNTWPPVQETCQLVFGWTKTNVLVIGALQAVGSILSVVPSSWFIDTKGKINMLSFYKLRDLCIQILLHVHLRKLVGLIDLMLQLLPRSLQANKK